MRIINKEEFMLEKDFFIKEIKRGAIFIYPTDTIYGIGCNATNDAEVHRIREIKKRPVNPFSIIAPSKKWIKENCITINLDELPGSFTYILKLKKKAISQYVNPGLDTIGVRIPKHWFSKVISEANIPFVTTSVNQVGKDYMTSLNNLDPEIRNEIDYIVFEGEKIGKPSTLIDCTKNKIEIKKR